MKSNPKPRGELEILLIVLGVLCLGLGAALAVQQPVLLLGVLLLAGGTAAAGFCAAGQLTKRARALQALLGALELM